MDSEQKKIIEKIANTIRELSIEAVEKANSGHPGLPLGCAELGAYLYGFCLRHNPKNPKWLGRDRFVLSAGHGSAFLYSCLHLAGFDLSLDELKKFRQLHSKTPGHPEYGETAGVEATTGPLGQGIGNAVGQALGLKLLGARFNMDDFPLFDGKVYCLAGDGCLMEGISSEASSLAGHLQLNNLVLIHDANQISLDGPLAQSDSEDFKMRYKAYGFDVYEVDLYDLDALHELFERIRNQQDRPVFVEMHTIIGKGSPNKAGTHKVHGSPLGAEELAATKKALGLPEEDFYIPQAVKNFFADKLKRDQEEENRWKSLLRSYSETHPDKYQEFSAMVEKQLPKDLEKVLTSIEIKSPMSGRKASQAVLQQLADMLPHLYGGSADLSGSDCTMLSKYDLVAPGYFKGRNIKYGVREFGMAAIAAGLAQTDMITPFIGTFFTFSDYMRNAIRLAALSHVHVIYQLTHDSVFLGEDGPTHQAVEHLASLRAMPNLHLMRPGDNEEVKRAWIYALRHRGPVIIVLTRQNLPEVQGTNIPYADGVGRGAYIVRKEKSGPDFTFFATGSELALACDAAMEMEKRGKGVRVVSMPCFTLFDEQDDAYKNKILGGNIGKRVCIEAGVSFGWHKYIGSDGITITIDHFGMSAPASDIARELGFTVDGILERLL